MSLAIEFFVRLLSLDLQWFIELAMDNIFWVFLFVLIAFVYNEFKWNAKTFFIVIFWFWISIPFIGSLGWIYLVGGFFFLNYVSRITLLTFTETIPSLKGRLPIIMLIQFFTVLIIYNLFLV